MVDTSAVAAILNDEPEAERCHAILVANEPLISCGTLIETFRVVQLALGPGALPLVDRLLAIYRVEQAPVDAGQVALARQAMLPTARAAGRSLPS